MFAICEVPYNDTKLVVKSARDCTVTALDDDILCVLDIIPITRISKTQNQPYVKIEIAARVITVREDEMLCLYKSTAEPILELTNKFNYDGYIGEIFVDYEEDLEGYNLIICKPINGTIIYHNGIQPNLNIFGTKPNLKLRIESEYGVEILMQKHKKDTYLIIS